MDKGFKQALTVTVIMIIVAAVLLMAGASPAIVAVTIVGMTILFVLTLWKRSQAFFLAHPTACRIAGVVLILAGFLCVIPAVAFNWPEQASVTAATALMMMGIFSLVLPRSIRRSRDLQPQVKALDSAPRGWPGTGFQQAVSSFRFAIHEWPTALRTAGPWFAICALAWVAGGAWLLFRDTSPPQSAARTGTILGLLAEVLLVGCAAIIVAQNWVRYILKNETPKAIPAPRKGFWLAIFGLWLLNKIASDGWEMLEKAVNSRIGVEHPVAAHVLSGFIGVSFYALAAALYLPALCSFAMGYKAEIGRFAILRRGRGPYFIGFISTAAPFLVAAWFSSGALMSEMTPTHNLLAVLPALLLLGTIFLAVPVVMTFVSRAWLTANESAQEPNGESYQST